MQRIQVIAVVFVFCAARLFAGELQPAPQKFRQEVARRFESLPAALKGAVQMVEVADGGKVRAFASGRWFEWGGGMWRENTALAAGESEFAFAGAQGAVVKVPVGSREVRQVVRFGGTSYIATPGGPFAVVDGKCSPVRWLEGQRLNQLAVSPEGKLLAASSGGLFEHGADGWRAMRMEDAGGRLWGAGGVAGVVFDARGRLWFASKAGVGCRDGGAWKFYEGRDGLPWNDFTGMSAGPSGEVWFATRLGVIRFDGSEWHYRQGPRWLPNDEVVQAAVDAEGNAWFATAAGVGGIERRGMTLAEKAALYEEEIERYVKRTPFGYVAEAPLKKAGDKSTADPQDSDNDGLWTAMYGAGECFAYAATKDPTAKTRAKKAFEALRFLQKVTEGGPHSPPKGYIARTIRPVEWPDPNAGRLEGDRAEQKHDVFWKVYEPRWPRSADGKWFWKSDTSSDELDGHYFFYALYHDLCAGDEAEKERVRDVVRGITDHLIRHQFTLVDHDGKPTRWGIYGPESLNRHPLWWPERGLNSLSMLSYLAVADHVTGDAKYEAASRELIDRHGYAHNAMYSKVQAGPGSGNQSDDEMAFMSYYSLLQCSKDETLRQMMRYSLFRYWINEQPELNPFFNFVCASQNTGAGARSPWGAVKTEPWAGWHEDSMATLYGFPLDRLNWPHRNSHRLDLAFLHKARAVDVTMPEGENTRGHRVNGKVLPVENRHFNHWNTDPWHLDYGGNGGELAAGTVFLLPYYMGLYHGYIEKPKP